MKEKLFMAVDLGTSFIKSAVYSLNGTLLAGFREPVKSEHPKPEIFIQRGDVLYFEVCYCLRKTAEALGERAGEIAAIAFTGQMAGSMGVDENWGDVTTWFCSLDSRYLPYADRQREAFGQEMYEIGGTNAPVMCAKYAWFQDAFPEEHRRIAKYVMLNGYIIGRLSGIPVEEAKIDCSLITWTGMADISGRRWSQELCRKMGVDMALLPQIVDCTAVGGYLAENVAKKLGLPYNIPLIVGAGDKVCGCVGAAVFGNGDLIFEAASYGAVSCKVPDVRLNLERRDYDIIGSADNSSFFAHKYIQGSGIAIDWYIENFIREKGMDRKEAFRRAEELAKGISPGSDGMMAIGLLGGSAIPFDNELRGLFMGHSWNHGKGHFYHALLECFSYELALTLESLADLYPECSGSAIKLIGGGAKSTVWSQMLADVTGHEFVCLDREDVALWGAALLAAVGVGEVRNLAGYAAEHIGIEKIYSPREAIHQHYAFGVKLYEKLRKQLHGYYCELNQWKNAEKKN